MSITDIFIILGILLSVALGVRDGLFKKLFGILGFIGGLIAATKFMSPLADIFISTIGLSTEGALIIAFFLIFIFVIIFMNLLYRWFGKTGSETIHFSSRLAGGIIGAFQGILAVSLILVMLDIFHIPDEETKKESILYEDTVQIAPRIFDYTTRWMPNSKRFFDEIKEKIGSVKNSITD